MKNENYIFLDFLFDFFKAQFMSHFRGRLSAVKIQRFLCVALIYTHFLSSKALSRRR